MEWSPTEQKERAVQAFANSFDDPIEYFASIHDVEITRIDIVAQQFSCSGFITLIWTDIDLPNKAIDGGKPLPGTDGRYNANYCLPDDGYIAPLNPTGVFANALEFQLTSSGISYDSASGGVSFSLRWKGMFHSPMYLGRFPCDRMHCQLTLKNQRSHFILRDAEVSCMRHTKLQIWEHERVLFSASACPAVHQEYELVSVGASISEHGNVSDRPKYFARVQRRSAYYMWRVVLPCFALGMLSLISFSRTMSMFSSRMSTCLAFLLAVFMLQRNINQGLPNATYMTLLDYYYVICQCFIAFVIFMAFVSAQLATDGASSHEDVDRITLGILLAVWAVYHVIVSLGCWLGMWSRTWEHVAIMTRRLTNNNLQKEIRPEENISSTSNVRFTTSVLFATKPEEDMSEARASRVCQLSEPASDARDSRISLLAEARPEERIVSPSNMRASRTSLLSTAKPDERIEPPSTVLPSRASLLSASKRPVSLSNVRTSRNSLLSATAPRYSKMQTE